MKLSFCLTTYNKKELLEIVLENYFANKKNHYQLIVSDGGSTDGTKEFLSDLHAQNLVDVLILPDGRDKGEWEGYKKTLDHVQGDYFSFLTDDDYFDFSAIDRILYLLGKNPNIDYLVSDGLDFKLDRVEHSNYHHRFKKMNSTRTDINHLRDGVCGLGLFVRSRVIGHLELFSPKFGRRTDKTVTVTLMNSDLVGSSTDIKTYVAIKNEKSNGYLYNYDFKNMEKQESLERDIDKDFLCDTQNFRARFDMAKKLLDRFRTGTEEMLIYDS